MHRTAATLQDLKATEVCLKQDKVMVQHTNIHLTEANWHCKCLHQVLHCIGFNKQALALAQHCMLTWIMHHPQAKQLSRREMLESAKQIPQWCLQSPHKASSRRGKKPSENSSTVQNFLATTASHYTIAQ